MIDISHKSNSLRVAVVQAEVAVSLPETIEALKEKRIPKGDVFEVARTAGLFGVKRTPDLIPDCHPLPVENTDISFKISDLTIIIEVVVKTIYKTGVEVEAMTGAAVTALTIYDMLKPVDKKVEIKNIRLLRKKGGKTNMIDRYRKDLNAAVIVCSDSISAGKKEDTAGLTIQEKLKNYEVDIQQYSIIPDDPKAIIKEIESQPESRNILIFCGGTGLSSKDLTPETIRPLLDREIQGISEVIRQYGQDRMPYAMLSRSVSGLIGKTLVLALPGSTKGAAESMDAIFPHVLHIFDVIDIDFRH